MGRLEGGGSPAMSGIVRWGYHYGSNHRAMCSENITLRSDIPRLSVELVPRSCWFSNVRSHVSRQVWNRLRLQTYEAAGHVCEICGGVGRKHPVECHEVWHYDDELLIQKLGRLSALCPRCHAVKHFGLSLIRGWEEGALRHLCKVNAWQTPEADAYIGRCFVQYQERSTHQWTLDLTLLEQWNIVINPRR